MKNWGQRGRRGAVAAWVKLITLAAIVVFGSGAASARHIVPVPKIRPAMEAIAPEGDAAAIVAAAPIPAEPPRIEPQSPAAEPKSPARPKSTLAPKSSGVSLPPLSSSDIATYRAAFTALAAGHYQVAQELAATGHVPVASKLITWLWLTRPGSPVTFNQLVDFIDHNPNWPAQDALQRRVEEALTDFADDARTIAWFKTREPLTAQGQLRLAIALLHTGQTQEGTARLRRAWVAGNFGQHEEAEILKNYHELLRVEDHEARLSRLLWDEDRVAAKRLEPRVPEAYRALAEARMALISFAPGVERLVARVPANLQNDPGLAFDRVRWRRFKGHDDEALQILVGVPADAPYADRWWVERQYQARRALANGDISAAYRLAAGHGVVDTRNTIDAEWLAGWIALRFLQERHVALTHFSQIYSTMRTPVSRARGAYWAGRAADALGDKPGADHMYASAADYTTTY